MKNLNYFDKLKVAQAIFFILIPLILIIVNDVTLKSISAYAYTSPMVFAVLLTLSSALFIYDGFVERNRWYNLYIGLSLLGVILFPNLDYPILHYIFATTFFLGSLFNIIFFSSNKERTWKIIIVIFTLFGMSGCFIFDWYSIFWAEWIGMIPITIHFILEIFGVID